jgi:alpha-L-fucosidase
VFNIKNVPAAALNTLVRDFEASQASAIEPNPWQTDICIGDWHYSRSRFENHRYRTPEQMVQTLVNVVSKNGNLLLNIPLPGHGRPDADEFAFLDQFGAWMAMNSEAIYSTRPWKLAGEGPTQNAGTAPYGQLPRFAPGDIRFTAKGDSLYAIALAWPTDGKLVIKSLAAGSPNYGGEIAKIGLLGSAPNLVWSRNADGVTVNLPEKPPCNFAYAFKVNPLGA